MIDRVTNNRLAQYGSPPARIISFAALQRKHHMRFRQFAGTAKSNVKTLAFPMLPPAPVSCTLCPLEITQSMAFDNL
jgi:hypothetical protein